MLTLYYHQGIHTTNKFARMPQIHEKLWLLFTDNPCSRDPLAEETIPEKKKLTGAFVMVKADFTPLQNDVIKADWRYH